MQDLTSICGSVFLQNYQMLKYKREKNIQLHIYCRKSKRSGSPQLCRCIKIIQASEYVFLSPVAMSGEITLPKVLALSVFLSLYCLCMRKENILLLLQFYLPQGLTVQNTLQSPSGTDRLAKGQILQKFLGKQNTLPAVLLFAFQSHSVSSAPYFFSPVVDSGLGPAFIKLLPSRVRIS